MFGPVIDHFCNRTPVGVMVRGLLEKSFDKADLQQLFADHARTQYQRKLLFSDIVALMAVVVCRIQPSISAAIKAWGRKLSAERKAVYDKINRTEPNLGRALVQHSARRLALVVDALEARQCAYVTGYRTRVVDGNHHPTTDHRIKELRSTAAGPLPGFTMVIYEPDVDMVTDLFPCEDGHESERSLHEAILAVAEPGDLWIADRNFCTTRFLSELTSAGAAFVIRDHAANAPWKPVEPFGPSTTCSTGEVDEQVVELQSEGGPPQLVRHLRINLATPLRNGDQQLFLLSNLPKEVPATAIAEAYRRRWSIETSFQNIEANLHSEILTLNRPRAALFAFAVACVAYNIYSTVKNSVRSQHGDGVAAELSGYDASNEAAAAYAGVDIGIPEEYWRAIAGYPPHEFAQWLRDLAALIPLEKFRKYKQHPKKPKAKPVYDPKVPHVSTARKLREANRSLQ